MDATECALHPSGCLNRKVTPAAKSLGVAIREALWLGHGKAPRYAPSSEPITLEANIHAPLQPIAEGKSDSTLVAAAAIETIEPASALPATPAAEIEAQVKESEIVLTFGENEQARRYRVRGLARNLSYDVLKVNALVAKGDSFFVDTLDLSLIR